MTEKEAWLEIAEMFDSQGPTWQYYGMAEPVAGICDALLQLCSQRRKISLDGRRTMINRLGKYFNPNGKNPSFDFFWPNNRLRINRTLRATACCFLAAMCDTVTPKRRGKGS